MNQAVQETDRRMSADRCGQLCAIAIANELYEGWMALFPILPVVYIALYFPNLTRMYEKADCWNKFMTAFFCSAFQMLGPERLQRLRDSRDTVPTAVTA